MKPAVRYCSQCRAPYPEGERFCPRDGCAIVESTDDDAQDPLIGRTIADRYLIRGRIGQGGMGVVYEGDHIALDKRVAIKFILDKFTTDQEVVARFHREARTASRIGHENIIDITDIGQIEGEDRSFIVMEYLEGIDLAELLRGQRALPPRRAVYIINQVLRGLAAAHEKGIIHRDMKPENVFLTKRENAPDFVKIMDFGISKIIDAHDSKVRLTETGAVVGTPVYMAPEQARADESIDHRADIYAAGVMFHEMLCGQPPFTAPSYLQLVTQHLFDTPPPLRSIRPDLPPILEQVVLRALEKDPGARYATARVFAEALPPVEAFSGPEWNAPTTLSGAAVNASAQVPGGAFAAPTTHPAPSAPRKRSSKPFIVVGAAVLIAAAMIIAALMTGGDETEPTLATMPEGRDAAPHRAPAIDATTPSVEPISGILEIDSRPQGARVFLDGEERGETPLILEGIAVGGHELRLEKRGYQTLATTKPVRAGYSETFFGALATRSSGGRSQATSGGKRTRPTPARPDPPATTVGDPAIVKPTPVDKPPVVKKPNPYVKKKPNPYN